MSSTPPRFLADVFVPFSSIVGVGYRSLGVGERVTLPIEHPGQDTVTGHQPVPASSAVGVMPTTGHCSPKETVERR